ncbi:MAG: hypothetical protein ACT4QE_20115, partial [Anaerolineales bacterium]
VANVTAITDQKWEHCLADVDESRRGDHRAGGTLPNITTKCDIESRECHPAARRFCDWIR